MTGETDSAQAELVYHVVPMAGSGLKSAQKKLRLHSANKISYIGRVLACATHQELYNISRI
jgi:hypothetical protein